MWERMSKVMFLLPMVMQVVQSVETLMAGKKGSEKKKAALEGVGAMTDEMERMGLIERDFNLNLDQTAGAVIDASVAGFNTLGLFKKDDQEPEGDPAEMIPEETPEQMKARYDLEAAQETERARAANVPAAPAGEKLTAWKKPVARKKARAARKK